MVVDGVGVRLRVVLLLVFHWQLKLKAFFSVMVS